MCKKCVTFQESNVLFQNKKKEITIILLLQIIYIKCIFFLQTNLNEYI